MGLNRHEANERKGNAWIDYLNPLVCRTPKRLFEFGDLSRTPQYVRQREQAILTVQWTNRLRIIQRLSPAELASNVILEALERMDPLETSRISIVDFCSGGGGPVPTIEQILNRKRAQKDQDPVKFVLTDINPYVKAWEVISSKSAHLTFIPEPVDATNPPQGLISEDAEHSSNNKETDSPKTKIFRLYCLAFHHFDDDLARKTLHSTLETADGFAIIELQDRRVFSFLLMMLDFFLVFFISILWFWRDLLHLVLTFILPVLPFVMWFDGTVSSLRTRTFGEVMALIGEEESFEKLEVDLDDDINDKRVIESRWRRDDWIFECGRERHTYPIGYMNWIVGRRFQDV